MGEGISDTVAGNTINSSNNYTVYVVGNMHYFNFSYNTVYGNRTLSLDVVVLETGHGLSLSVVGNTIYGGLSPCANNFLIKDNYIIGTNRVMETWCGARNHTYINNTVIATAGMAY